MNYDFSILKNGVRVILVPMAGVESTAVEVYVKTGSRYETEWINGLSHFLEHMVFKGTKKFPTHKDTSYLEGLGAIQNAWTDVDATAYWTKIVADKWRQGLELMTELALNPVFPAADLEIERGVIIEEINRKEDRPDEIVSEVLQAELFAGNPLGMTILGNPEVIKAMTRDDFVNYQREQYVAGRLAVVMAGKLDGQAEVKRQIEENFGHLSKASGRDFEHIPKVVAGSQAGVYWKKTADQVHFELGLRTFDSRDKRRFALAVLTSYLGQGLSSRLFTELREKRGLCYAVHASSAHLEDVGVWSVYAGAARQKFTAAVEAVWAEMRQLRETVLAGEDLRAAKEKLRGQLVFAKENPIHQMEFFARQVLDKPTELMSYDMIIDSLMGVTGEQIQEVAAELFQKKNIRLAIVGEIGEDEGQKLVSHLSD